MMMIMAAAMAEVQTSPANAGYTSIYTMSKSLLPQRVLIIGDDSLLAVGLEHLLILEFNLQVSTITYSDPAQFVQDIQRLQPDVVLLVETPELNLARFFELLRDVPLHDTLRVIVIHLENSLVDVYEKQRVMQVMTTQAQDLLNLIRGA